MRQNPITYEKVNTQISLISLKKTAHNDKIEMINPMRKKFNFVHGIITLNQNHGFCNFALEIIIYCEIPCW